MFKKSMLLAIAAAAVLALPASASASGMFYDNGGGIGPETLEIHVTGPAKFEGAAGSLECPLHISISIGTTKGSISVFNATNECTGTGAFANCEVTGSAAKGELTPTAEDIDIKEFELVQTLKNCAGGIPAVQLKGELTATPDSAESITSLKISGTLVATGAGEVTASGELAVEEAGTIGLIEI